MLAGMMRRLPSILTDNDLPAVELRAAELDGELGGLAGGWAVTDAPVTAAARAAAVAPGVPARAILIERCAAWVWGWTAEPSPVRVCVARSARIGTSARREGRIREAEIDADEIRTLGGVSITSPERTLVDLARFDERDDVVALLAAGIVAAAMPSEAVAAALDRRRSAAGRRRARERLAAALDLAHRAPEELALVSRC
ncbi:type IV toxin-antitoxin system AbiEi family antitoxin [Microcella alkalica]|uniref:type IV toxin-antitoxin system AbiEi family antitoxin n=1 Tax=Microcella alkalica TaxID=355930 RepID=UPI00145E7CBA|nr:type IV toxin-antitoxin system AbiEi family antitoxin [Microcella alkalica]